MATVSLEEAQAHLAELIHNLGPGEEVTITQAGEPLARLKKAETGSGSCTAGFYAKAEFWMAEDFDAPLDDFHKYTE